MLITLFSVYQMPTFRAYNSKKPVPGHDYAEMRGAIPKKLEVRVNYFEPILVLIYFGLFPQQLIHDSLNETASD